MELGGTLPGREERIVNLKPLYLDLDGTTMSQYFTIDNWRQAVNYKPRHDDIFIVTFPKCGTTWMQEITFLIFRGGNPPVSHLERKRHSPFLEMMGAAGLRDRVRPGCIKTHLPRNLIPYSDEAKYIFVLRNPKDCVVSYFHHQKETFSGYEFQDGKFEDFFELFMKGKNEYNDYFTHLLSWYPQTKLPNTILIHYEDLKKDPKSEILRLGKFLGQKQYKEMLENNCIDKIVKASTVDAMKKSFEDFEDPIVQLQKLGPNTPIQASLEQKTAHTPRLCREMIREGRVGGWRKRFTDSMNARLEEKIYEVLQPVCPEIVQKWKDHGIMS